MFIMFSSLLVMSVAVNFSAGSWADQIAARYNNQPNKILQVI